VGATARTVVREIKVSRTAALEEEILALRKEIRLLQLANEELERLVIRDTLTPLYNRRHFINSLNDRLSRLERYGTQTALAFIDVDSMKQINDVFGHSAGDFALIRIAEIFSSAIRSTDIAARVGGDEFALLLDGLDEQAAHEKMQLLCAMIAETKCVFDGKLLPLSISAGCTALRLGDNDFSAIARADMAMYAAKRPAVDILSLRPTREGVTR
jgi:diguanylate cyclase (GGDEF)-like protein